MWNNLMAALWRGAPRRIRRWSVRLTQARFAATAGAVVLDERGRVLLLRHVYRPGSGWGIPGGFIQHGEQPEAALRREVREETGMELDEAEIVFARTFRRPRQIEIIYRCRARSAAIEEAPGRPPNEEIQSAEWFELPRLPPELGSDQRRLIERALAARAA